MKKLAPLSILAALLILTVGCAPEAKKETPEPAATTGGTEDGSTTVTKKSDAEDVGDELRHEAYQYYGLGNTKVLVYDLTMNGATEEGRQEVNYQGMVESVPTYVINRTGSLSQLGNETLQLKSDGVLLSSTTMGDLNEPVIALPADVAVGKAWSDTRVITRVDGKVLEMTSNYKVEKSEKVTTPAGDFETLVIVSDGTIKHDGKTEPFRGQIYHAKGIGTVKLSISTGAANSDAAATVVTLKAIEDPE